MNTNNLTMKDLAEVEELTGMSMDMWETAPKAKLSTALAYVTAKKQNADLKWEDALNWTVEEMQQFSTPENPKVKRS